MTDETTPDVSRRAALLGAALLGLGAAGVPLAVREAAAQTDADAPYWVAIRTYQLKPEADRPALIATTRESFVPLLQGVPGFVAFYVLEPDAATWLAITVWTSAEAAKASTAIAKAWVEANVMASVASGPEVIDAKVDLVAFGPGAPGMATPTGG